MEAWPGSADSADILIGYGSAFGDVLPFVRLPVPPEEIDGAERAEFFSRLLVEMILSPETGEEKVDSNNSALDNSEKRPEIYEFPENITEDAAFLIFEFYKNLDLNKDIDGFIFRHSFCIK